MLILSLVALIAGQDTINIAGQRRDTLVPQSEMQIRKINPAALPPLVRANCPDFPGYVTSVTNSRGRHQSGHGGIRNGDTVTVTGKGFGEPGPYSMMTIWQAPPPFVRDQLGYSVNRVSWSDTKIVGQVRIVRMTRYVWDSSTTAYLEITRLRAGKTAKCGVKNLTFTRFPEG